MAEFDPEPPPLTLPDAPAVLSPNIPLNPPMVGEASPFFQVDGENRDLILESIRAWIRQSLLPWTASWQAQLTAWEIDAADQLNAWMALADTYITDHAVAGLSFRSTATAISGAGTTDVTLVVDTDLRPITVGDLVLSVALPGNYGIVTALIDDTHATVTYVGSLLGPAGYSWRTTDTPIADTGSTNVTVAVTVNRPLVVRDLIVDSTSDSNYGIVTAVLSDTTATVSFVGSLRGSDGTLGANGLSWRFTATAIGGSGTTDVTFAGSPDPVLQLGDLVMDTTTDGNFGDITVIIDATHATVSYLGNLKGAPGADGTMHSVVAGTGIAVDATDPANPIVSVNGAETLIFTDFSDLDAAHGSPNGSIASVEANGDTSTSLWQLNAGTWQAIQIQMLTNSASDWSDFVYTFEHTFTHLSLTGVTITEPITGSAPQWLPNVEQMVPDIASYVGPLGSNGNTDIGPGGSVVQNPDNSVQLNAISQYAVGGNVTPGFDIDLTDSWELRIVGEMSENGPVFLRFMNGGGSVDLNAEHYMGFGNTDQMTSGTRTHDAGWTSGFGDANNWSLVTDSTNSPTYIDATLTVRHTAIDTGGLTDEGFPVIAHSLTHYFTNPAASGGILTEFVRDSTHFYYGTTLRAFIIQFGDGAGGAPYFTGRISFRRIPA